MYLSYDHSYFGKVLTDNYLTESGGLFSKSKRQTANAPSVSDSMFVPSRADLGGFISSSTDTTIYPDDGPLAASVQDNIRYVMIQLTFSLGNFSIICRLLNDYSPIIYRLLSDYLPIIYRLFTNYLAIIYRLCTDYLAIVYRLYTD